MELARQLPTYRPYNEQEEKDLEVMLKLLSASPDIFTRDNKTAHFTSSSWTVNSGRDKVLMVYHKLYDSWAWAGGHADGETDLLQTACRELREETGARDVRPVSEDIFSIEIITVDGHQKRGEYVPSHLHLNVTYLLEADDKGALRVKEDENSGVRWFPLDGCIAASSEPWMRDMIYQKLVHKMRAR